jgi:hypothetical protein
MRRKRLELERSRSKPSAFYLVCWPFKKEIFMNKRVLAAFALSGSVGLAALVGCNAPSPGNSGQATYAVQNIIGSFTPSPTPTAVPSATPSDSGKHHAHKKHHDQDANGDNHQNDAASDQDANRQDGDTNEHGDD